MSNIQNQLTYANSLNLTKISIEENKPILKTEHNYLHICTFKSPTLSAFISDKGNHAISEGVKNGYTLIKKNPNTQKIEIIYPYNYEAKNNEILQKNCTRGIKSMINNWNNYITSKGLNSFIGTSAAYLELFLGIFIILGLFTRITAILIAVYMLYAIYIAHYGSPMNTYFYQICLVILAIIIGINDNNDYSIDKLIKKS